MPPKKNKESEGSKGKGKRPAKKNTADDSEPKSKKAKNTSVESEESVEDEEEAGEIDYACTTTCKKWNFKISSWNVNGIRAWLKHGSTLAYMKKEDADVFCIQETKCPEKELPKARNTDRILLISRLCSKVKPLNVSYGIGIAAHDNEGRVITAEFEDFYLVTAYIPNSGRGLERLDYRQGWDKDFRQYLKELDNKKPVVLCGDLNVAHKEIDLANPKTNKKTAGFTKEERQDFTELLEEGFVDSFRHFYPNKTKQYSFWSYMRNSRAKNVGWRLDYFVVSERLVPKLSDSLIRMRVTGSDHCPVVLLLAL
ncbi:DNA-(apurinic or apyrimidinic site) lyase [Stylophora pistillata]|uniref:DNA repair nuclease/redox regulator APEX1 n=1 Tax=Stylophora pistillata TaxID=50429 RepID=A0A2B4SHC9_STYPI|nr:DNA-(apurinic or apyrimidinic site) lyase [Stylophora pistillata]